MKNLFLLFMLFMCGSAHSQIITTIAGDDTSGFSGDGGPATAAKLNQPRRAWPDGAGNVYIATVSGNRIRKVNAAGIITTIAGSSGITVSGSGVPATATVLDGPTSVVVDTAGNIYFSETTSGFGSGSACVMRIDTSGIMLIFAGGGFGGPGSGDGGPATAAEFQNISDIALDSKGNMYILDPGKDNLRKVDTSGIITTIAGNSTYGYSGDGGPATAAQLRQPEGVAADGLGNIYISDFNNHCIRKVDTAGIITTIAGDSTAGYTGDGGPATAAQLRQPYGVAVDDSGNVYIADGGNYRVRKISAGIITTIAGDGVLGHSGDGSPATAAELSAVGVALDGAGDIYIADLAANNVRKVTMPLPVTTGVAPPGLPRGEEMLVYPNPVTTMLTINNPITDGARYEITDIPGRTVLNGTLPTGTQTIDVNALTPGSYIITLYEGDKRDYTKVFVKQ